MKSIAAVIVLCVGLVLSACSKKSDGDAIRTVTVAELETMLAKNTCTPVDANGPETRKNRGVIPGAIRLSDYETFAAAELPADKARALVFYCANEQCGASHEAAKKALATGHTDVRVLTAGIKGWVDAGKLVEPGA
jgi:rhodanese-related sulfurtransferase